MPFVRRQSCSHSCRSWRKSSRLDVVVFPVVTQKSDSNDPACMAYHRDFAVAVRCRVVDVPVVQVVLDSWCRREGDSRDLTAAAVEKSLAPGGPGSSPWCGPVVRVVLFFFHIVHMPVVRNDRCLVTFRSCSSSTRLSTPLSLRRV